VIGSNFHADCTARAGHKTEHPGWTAPLRWLVLKFAQQPIVKKVFRELGHQCRREAERPRELCAGSRTVCTEMSKNCGSVYISACHRSNRHWFPLVQD
jgi:hypothetical protein